MCQVDTDIRYQSDTERNSWIQSVIMVPLYSMLFYVNIYECMLHHALAVHGYREC